MSTVTTTANPASPTTAHSGRGVQLDQVRDDIGLEAVHQTGEGHEEDLERIGRGQHRPLLPGLEAPESRAIECR